MFAKSTRLIFICFTSLISHAQVFCFALLTRYYWQISKKMCSGNFSVNTLTLFRFHSFTVRFPPRTSVGTLLNTLSNGCRYVKDALLGVLRMIADSQTEGEYKMNLDRTFFNDVWLEEKKRKLRSCISNTWIPCYKVGFCLNLSSHLLFVGWIICYDPS